MNTLVPLSENDSRPLPLLVAEKWEFSLHSVYQDEQYWYAIQDWIVGLLETDTKVASKTWNDLQRRSLISSELSDSIRTLPYLAKDGKKYEVDYTSDRGLYLIAQHLRGTKERPLLREIKQFLAKAGAFVDLMRREPETAISSGAIDPDKAIEAAIAEYKRQGKSDEWINARIFGKLKRATFTAALKSAIADITQEHYRLATDDIYLGLWQRTARNLKAEMGLHPKANLRDHQPLPALHFQALAEDGCARKLGTRQELAWDEARVIVQEIADMVGKLAHEYGKYFDIDVATGRPLLPAST